MTIRKATEDDFSAIVRLIYEFALFQKTPEKVTITAEQLKADKDLFQCFVAEDDEKRVVGFASYFFTYYSWTGKALYLDDLYVTSASRGSKTGSMLLEAVRDLAKGSGCKKLRWQVSGWNQHAIDFYKKMGAVIDDTEINCDLVF